MTASDPADVRATLRAATDLLRAAGVPSPRVDAELLAAHVLGVDRGRLFLLDTIGSDQRDDLDTAVARRAAREPLQHIIGRAAFGPVELAVGPGVFVPRPETESLLEWAVDECARRPPAPAVVDLCAGSGALAIAVATSVPDASVTAVENDPAAWTWLQRNADAAPEAVRQRMTTRFADVVDPDAVGDLRADVVVSNPPYVPLGVALDPEVADHDPAVALFGGEDGMSVIVPMVGVIAGILRAGGACGIEHDDSTSDAVVSVLRASGAFTDITAHADLSGRPRFVTARRIKATPGPPTAGGAGRAAGSVQG
ncbi:peptide chain release factor N(5)-glutamine methyltransferase [Williamsia sp. MIQD14]|uniref:peptide chain release factor N(5)-glutamine methyltransferase n=1 Tax=Williamsia sp. MIQD14 TaxID=3425703 RepID=UPI003DA09A69